MSLVFQQDSSREQCARVLVWRLVVRIHSCTNIFFTINHKLYTTYSLNFICILEKYVIVAVNAYKDSINIFIKSVIKID